MEIRSAPDFAEFAEALKIRTVQILAVRGVGSSFTVIFTPEEDEDDLDPETIVWAAIFARGEDGILVRQGELVMLDWDWNAIQEEVRTKLNEKFGE